jgi:non-ribosomal peptide synthetase component F
MKYHWLHLLAALGSDPEQTVWQLPLFDQDERARLLNDPLASTRNFPLEERLDQLIARQARLQPNRSVILFGDSVLSFGELEAQANQLAHYLKSLGVTDGKAVGLCMDRSPELVIAMLAVLKAGGACLPLDPRYPADRLRFMLEDANPVVVFYANDRADVAAPGEKRTRLRWDTSLWAAQPATPPAPNTHPEQLAWLIYTSGTTGKPKGVMIPHRAIVNHFSWMGNTFAFSANDSVLAKTSISFDVSLWELLAPLISGAKLVLAAPGDEIDNQALIRSIVQQRITFLQMVPSHLNLFLREPAVATCSALKYVFCGGEAMPDDLPARFPGCCRTPD